MEYDAVIIKNLTGLSEAERFGLARFYARLPEALKLDVHSMQTHLMRDNRGDESYAKVPFQTYAYVMFLRAVVSLRKTEHALSRKQRMNLEQARLVAKVRIARAKAKPKKIGKVKERVEKLRPIIRQLRDDEHMSWREIEQYLKKYHRTDVSYAYLRQCY